MAYQRFCAEDFIKDDGFQQWVFSPDEERNAFWADFLRQHPEKQAAIREAKEFLLLFHVRESDVIESRIVGLLKRIDAEMDHPDTSPAQADVFIGRAVNRREPLLKWYVAAAVSMIGLVCGIYFFDPFSFSTHQEITAKGQRTFVTLEDGTKIWLNADSKLSYPRSFANASTREIQLEGEAYFDVTANKQKPFIVHTSDVRIKVLGTAFNVKSYGNDRTVETTLIHGKVTIQSVNDSSQITLLPNQQAVFEKLSGRLFLEHREEVVDYTVWKEGQLVFLNQPLSDIINELERWFNVTIQVEDRESLDCHFSAKVNNKTLEEVLKLFKDSESIDYTIEGSRVTIQGRLCDN
jgi:ferric-dicitrate binding protein FerR (iron transport regulator)